MRVKFGGIKGWGTLTILALLSTFLVGVPVMAHTAENPYAVPLVYGDKNVQVGWVYVWNDAANLYVQINTSAGWNMSETHLLVTQKVPINWSAPGQYPYQHVHNPEVTTDLYVLDRIADGNQGKDPINKTILQLVGTDVSLILHAVVWPEGGGDSQTANGNRFKEPFIYRIQGGDIPRTPALPIVVFPAAIGLLGLTHAARKRKGR
jgi:hypothetical protein